MVVLVGKQIAKLDALATKPLIQTSQQKNKGLQ